MITYNDIFIEKQRFTINKNFSTNLSYQFILNQNKGEFINDYGNVLAQLLEADPNKDWFAVTGVFMEDLIIKRSGSVKAFLLENEY
jgi:hypothetical protein